MKPEWLEGLAREIAELRSELYPLERGERLLWDSREDDMRNLFLRADVNTPHWWRYVSAEEQVLISQADMRQKSRVVDIVDGVVTRIIAAIGQQLHDPQPRHPDLIPLAMRALEDEESLLVYGDAIQERGAEWKVTVTGKRAAESILRADITNFARDEIARLTIMRWSFAPWPMPLGDTMSAAQILRDMWPDGPVTTVAYIPSTSPSMKRRRRMGG